MARFFFRQWAAAILVAAVAALWLATLNIQLIDKLQINGAAPMRPVSSGHELVQTVTAPGDNISRIDLTLGKGRADAEGRLRLQLVEVRGIGAVGMPDLGKTLREATLDTGSFKYTTARRFEFEPVAVNPGGTYAIRLTSDDPDDIAVMPGASPSDVYSGGRLYIDGTPTDADLYFALFHDAGPGGLMEKMASFRPFPLNSAAVIIFIFLIGAAAFGWLLWLVAGGGSTGQTGGPSETE